MDFLLNNLFLLSSSVDKTNKTSNKYKRTNVVLNFQKQACFV